MGNGWTSGYPFRDNHRRDNWYWNQPRIDRAALSKELAPYVGRVATRIQLAAGEAERMASAPQQHRTTLMEVFTHIIPGCRYLF